MIATFRPPSPANFPLSGKIGPDLSRFPGTDSRTSSAFRTFFLGICPLSGSFGKWKKAIYLDLPTALEHDNTMKEHPSLFSGPLVRAILSGEKTQTRRLVRGRALEMIERDSHELLPCPYGYEKDRLWVRETWGYDQDGPHTSLVLFRADRDDLGIRWRPSIHMPRWASRISLEVTEVRVQRIQDITEEHARAEGLPRNWTDGEPGWNPNEHGYLTPAGCYADESGDDSPECWVWWKGRREIGVVYTAREALQLWWDHINGERAGGSWKANPWVWAVSFKRVQA